LIGGRLTPGFAFTLEISLGFYSSALIEFYFKPADCGLFEVLSLGFITFTGLENDY
jgi:hypothetical protein